MRLTYLKSKILSLSAWLAALILVLMPFHAFLTVWVSSQTGHYIALRLWKEALLILLVALTVYLFVIFKDKLTDLDNKLLWLIAGYVVINLVWGAVSYSKKNVDLKALVYALIANLRFLAFFVVTWIISRHSRLLRDNWQKIIILPAALVIIFGVIQEFLPANFLEHFGYSSLTVLPFQYVDNNNLFLRVQSTLRGANPLGAYLMLAITILLATTIIRERKFSIHDFYSGKFLLTITAVVVLFFTYSRAAWLGFVLSAVTLFVMTQYTKPLFKRYFVAGVAILLIFSAGIAVNIKHNKSIQNAVLHTSQSSKSAVTSNESHLAKLEVGAKEVAAEPLGRGPGTAGPASVYNNHPARIAENYYIQIGQELGWLGLAGFLLINIRLAYLLWLQRHDVLALSLFASLIGISFINLLSHAWTDDTLAYIWWGLAGVAMANGIMKAEDGKAKKRS